MRKSFLLSAVLGVILSACAGIGGERVVVDRVGSNDLLKLRSGPSLEYNIIMGLPDGTELIRRDCVTEVGQLWCRVVVADTPQVTGWVSADYLTAG